MLNVKCASNNQTLFLLVLFAGMYVKVLVFQSGEGSSCAWSVSIEVRRLTFRTNRIETSRTIKIYQNNQRVPEVGNFVVDRNATSAPERLVLESFLLHLLDSNTTPSSAGSPCSLSFLLSKHNHSISQYPTKLMKILVASCIP